MIYISRLTLTLFATLALVACQPFAETPINPNSTATFGIHAVLQDADGMAAVELPDKYVLGEDVLRFTDENGTPLFITLPAVIDKPCLKSISADMTEYAGPVLNFSLTPECSKTFGRFTAQNIGQRMALVLNRDLVTAPYIRAAITGGSGSIDDGFETLAEAEAIAKQFY